MADQEPGGVNPFIALQNEVDPVLEGTDPGLLDRFWTNFQAGQSYNTVLGAGRDASTPERQRERKSFDRTYETYPEWDGMTEGAAALGGQIAGTAMSPENFIPIGLGEKILVAGKAGLTGLWARVFSGAVDAAAANAVADAAIQGIEIQSDFREQFDPLRYGASVLLGAGIGGLGGAAGKMIGDRAGKAAPGEKAAVDAPPADNPFLALQDPAPAIDVTPPVVVAKKPGSRKAKVKPSVEQIDQVAAPPVIPAVVVSDTIGETLSAKGVEVRGLPPETPAAVARAFTPDEAKAALVAAEFDFGKLPEADRKSILAAAPPEAEAMILTSDALRVSERKLDQLKALPATEVKGYDGSRVLSDVAEDGSSIGRSRLDDDFAEFGHTGYTEKERPALIAQKEAEIVELKAQVEKLEPRVADLEVVNQARSIRGKEDKTIGDFLMSQPLGGLSGQRTRASAAAPPAQVIERIGRVRETAETLAKALDVTATRQGRISGGKKVLGTYDTGDGVVRVRSLDDFDVLSHEYGHHLDAKVPAVKGFIKKFSKDLAKLDYDPLAGRDFEGFAEFFRLYLTNRPYVEKNMAQLSSEFRQVLDQAPAMRDAIDAATSAWDDFLSAPSTVAVRSTIVSGKKDGWIGTTSAELRKSGLGGTVADVLQRIYAFCFDDLHPINRTVSYLQDLHLTNKGRPLDLKVSENPYKLARMSRGSYSAGHMDIMYGVAPYRSTNPASPSLRDAIIEATAKPNGMSKWDEEKVSEFGSYLWSRRAIGEWERYRNGDIPNPPDKLTEADHHQNVADLEAANPAYGSAAAKVHEFGRALWKKKLDAGLIDQVTHDEGLMIKDYVPGLRDFSSDTDMKVPPGQSKGKTAKGGFAKRFRGSKRDVINPLESMAADAYETSMAIARNDVVKALHRLSLNAGPGAGAIAEVIPAKEMRGLMIDPLEAVENAAKAAGLSKPDIVLLRDAVESAVGSEKAAVFRPAIINDKGEPIVFFRDGGKLTALRLADGKFGLDMYRAITAMSPGEKNFWLELVAIPARVMRAGITTSFEFIGANFVRDQVMASVMYGKPLRRIGNSLKSGLDEVRGKDITRAYSRTYGISGGQETASLSKAMAERDLSALKRKGYLAQRLTSFKGVLELAEIAETSTRIGLFKTFRDEAMKRGLDENEALFEASWRARDYLDFDRRGFGMTALARVIPFLNVALQGLDKSARHMIAPVARKVLGQANTIEDKAAAALATKTWARLAALVTGSVSLYALQSKNEGHDEISETTRATHWMVKTGEKWTAIPKPYEFAIAINLGEAMFDTMIEKDPAAAGRWLDSVSTTVTPPSLLEGNPAIKSYFEIKSNTNFFTDAPIVPDALLGMEPYLQYTERTSAFSKQLGQVFGSSPAITDHLITSFGGGWGRNLLSAYDLAQPDAPAAGWDDVPIARRFIKDAAKGSQSTTMFWAMAGTQEGKLEGKLKSWEALAEGGDAAGAADLYASLDQVEKAYVGVSTLDAKTKRLHPIIRARGAIQAIGTMRRELAGSRLVDAAGEPVPISPAERTSADDILSTLAMAVARNGLKEAGVIGWAQRDEMDETGFYRELEAVNPALLERLGNGYVTKKVWRWDAVKSAWPALRDRVLEDGSNADVFDLVADVQSQGFALDGEKIKRPEKPALTP